MVSLRPPDGLLLRGMNEVMEDYSLGTLLQRVEPTDFEKNPKGWGVRRSNISTWTEPGFWILN